MNRERARAAYQLGRYEDAVREAGLSVAADPEDFEGFMLLGHALLALGRDDEALRATQAGLQKSPECADLHVLHSDVLRATGQTFSALQAAEEAVRLEPDNSSGHCAVALSAAACGDHGRAVRALVAAVKLDPGEARLHRMLADQYLDLHNNPDAEATYRQALRLEPNDASTLNNLGCALQRQGRQQEAAMAFKAAVLVDPSLTVAKTNTRETLRGMLGGASALGVLALMGLKVVKFKLLWIVFFARQWLVQPVVWLAVGGSAAAVFLFLFVRSHLLLRQLMKKDPQLVAIFRQIEADHRKGRLK